MKKVKEKEKEEDVKNNEIMRHIMRGDLMIDAAARGGMEEKKETEKKEEEEKEEKAERRKGI